MVGVRENECGLLYVATSTGRPTGSGFGVRLYDHVLVRGPAETPRARAAIHGWRALQMEQAVSYVRSRNFAAILDH